MIYLLDANVLMTAHNLYYPLSVVPEFWEWLAHQAAQGLIKMPEETFGELKDGDDHRNALLEWAHNPEVSSTLRYLSDVDPAAVRLVLENGYGLNLTDDELETIGQDPFLIAHALPRADECIVVTTEVSQPKKKRQNRKVPDVCRDLGIQCCDTFRMLRDLQFSTSWKK
jgi:hypothetical protein